MTWRKLSRNKTSSFINISGLAIGMASFIMILLYVQDELKYDKFLNNHDKIYQVTLNGNSGEQEFFIGKTPASVSSALMRNFPEIESAVRIYKPGDMIVRSESSLHKESFTESSVLAVDSCFFNVFPFELKKGNAANCLMDPGSVVITENIADKYFGSADPLGKILLMDKDQKPFKITAVLKNLPEQSTLRFDMLTSTEAFPVVKRMSWSWVWLQVCTYIRLKDKTATDPASIQKLDEKFPAMVKLESGPAFKRVGQSLDDMIKKGGKWDLHLLPYTKIHLYSGEIGQILDTVSDIKYVYTFSIIAFFIILLACVNFMNLSTAQASSRAKEVGVRKVLGSEKNQLIRQFLAEALLFSSIAAIISIILVIILLNPFNSISGKNLSPQLIFSGEVLLYTVGLIVLTGFLAGIYPAFYLSSFQPAAVIKGIKQISSGLGSRFIRNGLVVFQFSVSTAMIICTVIVFKQLDYMQTTDIGLNKEQIIVIKNSDRLGNKETAFKNLLAQSSEIKKVSIASGVPTRENFGDGYVPEVSTAGDQLVPDISLSSFIVDDDFIPSLDIKILKGRNFSKEFSDSGSVILNEKAVKDVGWKNPVGSYMTYPGNANQRFKVIGVVKDFNINSLHSPVTPFALFHKSSNTYNVGSGYTIVKCKENSVAATIEIIKEKWKQFSPSLPLDLMFLDEEFEALYKAEKRVSQVFFIFTGLSIFVACLGLFGLAIYNTERRTKEIGVRKVLGASVSRLVTLLSGEFIKLIAVSVFIAFPVAWWAMNKWLENFAYRTTLDWWIFAGAAFVSVSLTLFTVGFHIIKAAVTNPVKSLRTE
jgi:putative ABC transport system permease protein